MISEILERNDHELFIEATHLLAALEQVKPLQELITYQEWLLGRIEAIQTGAQDAITVLSHGFPELIPELLSRTQQLRREFGIIRDRLISPLTRASSGDRMSLRILTWLHATLPVTASIPFALSDGGFASWPWPPYAALYFGPAVSNGELRFKPLFFHEFGHVIYAARTTDFDPIVGQLQRDIDRILSPRSIRNDSRALAEARERALIVETWYEWAQEFFCDAVGLCIGGPAFLLAFSAYLQLLGAGDFPNTGGKRNLDNHPPTRLRIDMLLARARRLHLSQASDLVGQEWEAISQAVGFDDDYFGFYVPEMAEPLSKTVDGMLRVAEIRMFTANDLEINPQNPTNPVQLTNAAWALFQQRPDDYSSWEKQAIAKFLEEFSLAAHNCR